MSDRRDGAGAFDPLDAHRALLLTSFRPDGTPVTTRVTAYRIHEAVFLVVDPCGGLARRLRENPHVTVAPCGLRGNPVGPTLHARVRVLDEQEADRACGAFSRTHRFVFRVSEGMARLRNGRRAVYELLPAHTGQLSTARATAGVGDRPDGRAP